MLSRENQSYDYRYVTKENQPFKYQCGHIITPSNTAIVKFNNVDKLNMSDNNKDKEAEEKQNKEPMRHIT